MKLKKSLIAGMIPLLLTGSILAGCSGGQSQTAINNAQETTTASENNSSNEIDDKIYNIVEYVQSGKPFFMINTSYADSKNNFVKEPYVIKDNKLYSPEELSTEDINITLGDYSNMTDDEFFDLLSNSKIYQKSYPGCFAVYSDKSGNNLNSIYFYYNNPDVSDSDNPYRLYIYWDDELPIKRSFDVYDSSFIENNNNWSFRSNKPFKTIGTLEDYKHMDGVLVDPTKDEIKAALGI